MLHVDRTFDVLITDDNASFRRVLREVLEDRPFLRLHEAESGEQALEVVTIQRIDIVLLDMHMHVLTGLETLKVLKRLDRLRPCILILRIPVTSCTVTRGRLRPFRCCGSPSRLGSCCRRYPRRWRRRILREVGSAVVTCDLPGNGVLYDVSALVLCGTCAVGRGMWAAACSGF